MLAVHRLKENRDFRRVFRRGKSVASAHFVLYWNKNRESHFRVGFSVSKKVGNAVERNRLKRLLRECFHSVAQETELGPVDFVIVCRPKVKGQPFAVVQEDIRKLLRKAKFMV